MKKPSAFTVVEMIVSITLFAFILIVAFAALGNVGKDRLRISNQLDLNRDLYYAVEKFVSLVKEGGTLDYEEYWNRTQIGTSTIGGSGGYATYGGYGNYGAGGSSANYGSGYYYCGENRSNTGGVGCPDATSTRQRYGQYAFQFIYYGTEGTKDDDEDLGQGPGAIPLDGSGAVRELYLIKKRSLPQERLLFRLRYTSDLDAPATAPACDADTGSGCIGKLQMLRLTGHDKGFTHNNSGTGSQDGITDTWECSTDFCTGIPSDQEAGWVDVLPSYIDVRELRFFPSPKKDGNLAWKDIQINNPYVRISMKIGFTWAKKKQLRVSDPIMNVNTTINLSE